MYHEPTSLLRFTTAGSVDDGKSTLIGRLLYDSKSIFEDQINAVEAASTKRGKEQIDLSLLTDGLKAEREQGITIDVAYRYFATPNRKFIIADTPGHAEYTRNMVTGSSTADVALVLCDVRHGMVEQSKRHLYIASLLGIEHIIICVNKMDLVGFDQAQYDAVVQEFSEYAAKLPNQSSGLQYVPISALEGDNVVHASDHTPWYDGQTLMQLLENLEVTHHQGHQQLRFPVQGTVRVDTAQHPDYRAYTGQIAGGTLRVGDAVEILPAGRTSTVTSIETMTGTLETAVAPQSVSVRLADDIDLPRGEMIVRQGDTPTVGQELKLRLCWLSETPLNPGRKYVLQHTSNATRCVIKDIEVVLDINTLEADPEKKTFATNDLGRIVVKTMKPIVYDPYEKNRVTGSVILIDEATHVTVAGGMIV